MVGQVRLTEARRGVDSLRPGRDPVVCGDDRIGRDVERKVVSGGDARRVLEGESARPGLQCDGVRRGRDEQGDGRDGDGRSGVTRAVEDGALNGKDRKPLASNVR